VVKEEIELGALQPTRDLVLLKITARGFIEIAKCDTLIGEEVNIATQLEISIGDLAQTIISQINKNAKILTDVERLRPKNSEVERLLGKNSKLLKHTGWIPGTELETGLMQLLNGSATKNNFKQYKTNIYNV